MKALMNSNFCNNYGNSQRSFIHYILHYVVPCKIKIGQTRVSTRSHLTAKVGRIFFCHENGGTAYKQTIEEFLRNPNVSLDLTLAAPHACLQSPTNIVVVPDDKLRPFRGISSRDHVMSNFIEHFNFSFSYVLFLTPSILPMPLFHLLSYWTVLQFLEDPLTLQMVFMFFLGHNYHHVSRYSHKLRSCQSDFYANQIPSNFVACKNEQSIYQRIRP